MKKIALLSTVALLSAASTQAAIYVTEVDPSGSSASVNHYAADWFELTNTGPTAVNITGWKVDDNSNSFASSVALNGVTSLAAGQSVIFIESSSDAIFATFESDWFGANVPAGFTIGRYNGSGVGLSTGGDAINIFDAAGNRITGIAFGSSTDTVTFDNTTKAGGTTLPLPVVSTISVVGVNAAFLSPAGETGSPGVAPEPATLGMLVLAGAGLCLRRRARGV